MNQYEKEILEIQKNNGCNYKTAIEIFFRLTRYPVK